MFYWNPSQSDIQTWQPVGGWNHIYSERDRMQGTALYTFLTNRKHYSSNVASTLVQMILSKQVYRDLMYSEEQEEQIKKALTFVKGDTLIH